MLGVLIYLKMTGGGEVFRITSKVGNCKHQGQGQAGAPQFVPQQSEPLDVLFIASKLSQSLVLYGSELESAEAYLNRGMGSNSQPRCFRL